MNKLEAINLLIQLGKDDITKNTTGDGEITITAPGVEDTLRAVVIVQSILDAALPIARFRCFVEADVEQPRKKKGLTNQVIHDEFVVSSTTISGITGGLVGLSMLPVKVRVMLFEQKATSAEMVSGYQGMTKNAQYRSWLESIAQFEAKETTH